MIRLPIFQALVLLFGAALLYPLKGSLASMSFAVGAGISLINLATISMTWPYLLAKKLVALSIGVIVFKFAILGWIIYEVVNSPLQLAWVGLGLASVVVSVLMCVWADSMKLNPASSQIEAEG